MRQFRTALLAAAVLTAAVSSCRKPSSYEQFIRADRAEGGEYVFCLDMSDTLACYDVSLYTRVDAAFFAAARPYRQLRLEISWIAPVMPDSSPVLPDATLVMPDPDRASLSETVYIPYGGRGGSAHLYRSGVKPSPAGEWTVAVRPLDAPKGLRGMGIICKRKD